MTEREEKGALSSSVVLSFFFFVSFSRKCGARTTDNNYQVMSGEDYFFSRSGAC